MFTAKLLLVLGSITVLFLRGEAAGAVCGQRSPFSTIQALPGKPGKNGAPGVPGPKGEAGTVPDAVIEQLRIDILEQLRKLLACKGFNENNPATSCKEIHDCNPTAPSGYYWVNTTTRPLQVYCQMETSNCGNITGGWMRVAHINMSESEQTCPSPLRTLTSPQRMCAGGTPAGCYSVQYPTLGLNFTQVCGQAIGYMYFSADGLDALHTSKTIDSPYVDGLSITYGSPRRHLWTYAAGHRGQHFYCDGNNGNWDYSLWDGEGCPAGNTCCDPPNLPWFHRTLGTATTDDIEVRWCRDQEAGNEDVGVVSLELYVY